MYVCMVCMNIYVFTRPNSSSTSAVEEECVRVKTDNNAVAVLHVAHICMYIIGEQQWENFARSHYPRAMESLAAQRSIEIVQSSVAGSALQQTDDVDQTIRGAAPDIKSPVSEVSEPDHFKKGDRTDHSALSSPLSKASTPLRHVLPRGSSSSLDLGPQADSSCEPLWLSEDESLGAALMPHDMLPQHMKRINAQDKSNTSQGHDGNASPKVASKLSPQVAISSHLQEKWWVAYGIVTIEISSVCLLFTAPLLLAPMFARAVSLFL